MSALGPTARAVLALRLDGSKRRKLLALIAVYFDAGRPDPSITELCARSGIERNVVLSVLDRLEADGLLSIEHGDPDRNERSTYRVNVKPKEKPVSTHAPIRPRQLWREADFVPTLEVVEFPVYERPASGGAVTVDLPTLITAHREAVAMLAEAEAAEDDLAIAEATLALVDAVEAVVPAIWEGWDAIDAARREAGAAAVPAALGGEGPMTGEADEAGQAAAAGRNATQAAEAEKLRPTREAVERDMRLLGELRLRVIPDSLPDGAIQPIAAAVAQAREVRRELEGPGI